MVFTPFGFCLFRFALRSEGVPKGKNFSPLTVETKNTHRQTVKGKSTKTFCCCFSGFKQKVFCPLTVWLADLAFSRRGSGVLPAKRLVGLCCFTIRKAKGKIQIKKQPSGCYPL